MKMILPSRKNKFLIYSNGRLIKVLSKKGNYNIVRIKLEDIESLDRKDNVLYYLSTSKIINKVNFIVNVIEKLKSKNIKILFYEATDIFRMVSIKIGLTLIAPECVSFDISDKCNTNCVYCWSHSYLGNTKIDSKYMPLEGFKKIVNELCEYGTEYIEFSGIGEPFTNPNIMEMLRFVYSKNLGIYVYTNGLLLSKDIVQELVSMNIGLIVNLSAPNFEIYNKIHSNATKLQFQRLLVMLKYYAKLQSISRKDYIFTAETVLCEINYRAINEIIDFTNSLGFNKVNFNMFSSSSFNELLIIKDRDELFKCIQEVKNNSFSNNLSGIDISNIKNFTYHTDLPCYDYWFYVRIFVEGVIVPCTEFSKFSTNSDFCSSEKFEAFNFLLHNDLFSNSFESIWTSKSFNVLRKSISNPSQLTHKLCKKCIHACHNVLINKMTN